MPVRSTLLLAAVVLLAPAGCGPARLDEKKTYTVSPGDTQMMLLSKQSRPQRITVEYQSDQPVEVGIYKAEDVTPDGSTTPSKALALEKAKTSGTISADLGPDVATTITVTALGKTASVTLNVHNKK